jgi:signal transduction histidine kinase
LQKRSTLPATSPQRAICWLASSSTSRTFTLIIDGFRARAKITHTSLDELSSLDAELWRDHRARVLCRGSDSAVLQELPEPFRREDMSEIRVQPQVISGKVQAVFILCKRRQPFDDLDMKFLALACLFFHTKVHMLWEQQKLRELETAYLQQEIMLRQSEKLATLGKLSAGMAHELNNPAAAARRGAEQLRDAVVRLQRGQFAMGTLHLTAEQIAALTQVKRGIEEQAAEPVDLDPITRSDREQEVEDWLAKHGVDQPWEQAPTLVSMGQGPEELEALAQTVGAAALPTAITCLSSDYTAYTLLEEIGQGAGRIAEIVKALKSYSYLDQAPIQDVDVREGLDDTLVMLRSKLREGINVTRDYGEDLPRIQAFGSELNQVWTNIIDNAIAAMEGTGSLVLRTRLAGSWVVVEITDDGPGIPAEAHDKIYDPFFTTKPPGEGTGLGLNITHNIVQRHKGQISASSKPGETRFTVRLPLSADLEPAAGSDPESST